jgi:hypothetical protein
MSEGGLLSVAEFKYDNNILRSSSTSSTATGTTLRSSRRREGACVEKSISTLTRFITIALTSNLRLNLLRFVEDRNQLR